MNAQYFIDNWKERKHRTTEEMRAYWDGRAADFNAHTKSRPNDKLAAFLEEMGALSPENTVLDVGCGSGRHALNFAGKAKHVTGIDISPNMVEICRENAREAGIPNTTFEAVAWEEADVDALGYKSRFDLAFSSMSPAISNIVMLDKLISCSKKHCFVSGFISRTDSLYDYLYREVTGEKPATEEYNIYYIFNILWQRGIYPELRYEETGDTKRISVHEAAELYTTELNKYGTVATDSATAEKAFSKIANGDNMLESRLDTRRGWLYWQI